MTTKMQRLLGAGLLALTVSGMTLFAFAKREARLDAGQIGVGPPFSDL